MKKLAFAALFLLVLSSCAAPEPGNISTEIADDSGDIYRLANNNAVDFYFYYPENFVIDRNSAMISVQVSDTEFVESELETGAGESIPVNPNLSASVFTLRGDYKNAEEYWQNEVKPSYSKVFHDMFIESSEDIEIAGADGRKYVYTAGIGGQEYKYAQVIFLKNNEVYILLYTATPEKFDKHSRVLDVAADTFAFK